MTINVYQATCFNREVDPNAPPPPPPAVLRPTVRSIHDEVVVRPRVRSVSQELAKLDAASVDAQLTPAQQAQLAAGAPFFQDWRVVVGLGLSAAALVLLFRDRQRSR
jgi:hypothetical protein